MKLSDITGNIYAINCVLSIVVVRVHALTQVQNMQHSASVRLASSLIFTVLKPTGSRNLMTNLHKVCGYVGASDGNISDDN